jgi:hypothetical protein
VRQVAASADRALKVPRRRVNDNMVGRRHFCPTVVKTDAFHTAAGLDVTRLFGELTAEIGEDLLMRAVAWMSLRESKVPSADVLESAGSPDVGEFP